nr:hypothetical protein CFP56_50956 [Quercus suber]
MRLMQEITSTMMLDTRIEWLCEQPTSTAPPELTPNPLGSAAFSALGVYSYASGMSQLREREREILRSGSRFGLGARKGAIYVLSASLVGLGGDESSTETHFEQKGGVRPRGQGLVNAAYRLAALEHEASRQPGGNVVADRVTQTTVTKVTVLLIGFHCCQYEDKLAKCEESIAHWQ